MIIDKLNTFYWKKDLTGSVVSDSMLTSGDADPNLWLVIRVDKTLTGTAVINVYTSDAENIANAVLLHGITLPTNAPAGYEYKVRLANGVKRYIRTNVNNATAGQISIFMTNGITSK